MNTTGQNFLNLTPSERLDHLLLLIGYDEAAWLATTLWLQFFEALKGTLNPHVLGGNDLDHVYQSLSHLDFD